MKGCVFNFLVSAGCVASAAGAEIRAYDAERHDRFTDFPETPAWNEASWTEGRRYAGVGWRVADPRYQFALVTPQHFVCATHARPPVGTVMRFLQADGVEVDRVIASHTTVLEENGLGTDLTVSTLDEAVPGSLGFFPVLNLPQESAYTGLELIVFGWTAKVGRGRFAGFSDTTSAGLGETRLFRFNYRKSTGTGDDVFLQGGDSGSPSFTMVDGAPALVGIHAAVGEDDFFRVNYDTFVPRYVDSMNGILDARGYRITPTYPPSVELETELAEMPGTPRQGMPWVAEIAVKNPGGADASNVRLSLEFPEDAVPESLEAPGWIVESQSGATWNLRRGGVDGMEELRLTASWAALPVASSLVVTLAHFSDGSPLRTRTLDVAPQPSYLVWSEGLADPAPEADPDGDGFGNLAEYAFRTDAADAASWPQISFSITAGVAELVFPVLPDAEQRGVTYTVEFSDDLETWTDDPPAGFDGGVRISPKKQRMWAARFDVGSPAKFSRVRVSLEE